MKEEFLVLDRDLSLDQTQDLSLDPFIDQNQDHLCDQEAIEENLANQKEGVLMIEEEMKEDEAMIGIADHVLQICDIKRKQVEIILRKIAVINIIKIFSLKFF